MKNYDLWIDVGVNLEFRTNDQKFFENWWMFIFWITVRKKIMFSKCFQKFREINFSKLRLSFGIMISRTIFVSAFTAHKELQKSILTHRKKFRQINYLVITVSVIWNCHYSTVLGHFVTQNFCLHEMWNLLSFEICPQPLRNIESINPI